MKIIKTKKVTKKDKKDYSNSSKESVVNEIAKLEISKKLGWWNYYNTVGTLETVIRDNHKKENELKEELKALQSSELVLPDYIIKLINRESNTFECPCCKDDLELAEKDKYLVTVCGHFFCKTCFYKWTESNYTCPTCRGTLVNSLKKKWAK